MINFRHDKLKCKRMTVGHLGMKRRAGEEDASGNIARDNTIKKCVLYFHQNLLFEDTESIS